MTNDIATTKPKSVLVDMANRYGMEPGKFEQVLRKTVVPEKCGPEEFAAFLLVAKEYNLNPITREIYAFPNRGGIQPIVGIDGWMSIINSHPQFDGMDFEDHLDEKGSLVSIRCRLHRKDRSHPVEVIEYLEECSRPTEPWKKWPARMLRHKAAIQAARYAFGLSGIVDPDEAERIKVSDVPSPDMVVVDVEVEEVEPKVVPLKKRDTSGKSYVEQGLEAQAKLSESEPDIFDADVWLDDLEQMIGACKTKPQIDEIWEDYGEPKLEAAFPPDKESAISIRDRHYKRVEKSGK